MKEVCVVMSCNIRKTEGSLMKGTWHRPVLSIKKDVFDAALRMLWLQEFGQA